MDQCTEKDLFGKTITEDFPDGSQPPEYYIEKYHLDEDFRWWFEENFDRTTVCVMFQAFPLICQKYDKIMKT